MVEPFTPSYYRLHTYGLTCGRIPSGSAVSGGHRPRLHTKCGEGSVSRKRRSALQNSLIRERVSPNISLWKYITLFVCAWYVISDPRSPPLPPSFFLPSNAHFKSNHHAFSMSYSPPFDRPYHQGTQGRSIWCGHLLRRRNFC